MSTDKKLVDVSKKYATVSGLSVRIICADRKRNSDWVQYPIVALVSKEGDEIPECYTAYGEWLNGHESDLDLVEVSLWDDIKVDDIVHVRDDEGDPWRTMYFAGVENGRPTTFLYGASSKTTSHSEIRVNWKYCEKV